jgi:hypothetical protein
MAVILQVLVFLTRQKLFEPFYTALHFEVGLSLTLDLLLLHIADYACVHGLEDC